MSKYNSTLLAQENTTQEIQKADLDLLSKINDLASSIPSTDSLFKLEYPIITEWESYVPTILGFGITSLHDIAWRQVGSDMQIRGFFSCGTATAVPPYISLPPGKSASKTQILIGKITTAVTSSNLYVNWAPLIIPLNDPTRMSISNIGNGSVSFNLSPIASTMQMYGPALISFFAEFPCDQFKANNTIDINKLGTTGTTTVADEIVYATMYVNTSPLSITTDVAIPYGGIAADSHGCLTAGTGARFTCKVAGRYKITGLVYTSGVNEVYYLWKNGAKQFIVGFSGPDDIGSLGGEIDLLLDDYIDIRGYANNTMVNLSAAGTFQVAYNWVTFTRIGSYQAAPIGTTGNTTVAAEMWASADVASSSTVALPFHNVKKDTHGCLTVGTGARFTCKVAGRYSVKTQLGYAGNSQYAIFKNGTNAGIIVFTWANAASIPGSREIDLAVGDYIDIRNIGAGAITYGASAVYETSMIWMQITRIGT